MTSAFCPSDLIAVQNHRAELDEARRRLQSAWGRLRIERARSDPDFRLLGGLSPHRQRLARYTREVAECQASVAFWRDAVSYYCKTTARQQHS